MSKNRWSTSPPQLVTIILITLIQVDKFSKKFWQICRLGWELSKWSLPILDHSDDITMILWICRKRSRSFLPPPFLCPSISLCFYQKQKFSSGGKLAVWQTAEIEDFLLRPSRIIVISSATEKKCPKIGDPHRPHNW